MAAVAFALLPVAGRQVLGYGVAEYAVLGLVVVQALALLADNDRQLGFPVDFLVEEEKFEFRWIRS